MRALEIAEARSVSIRTVRRALSWYSVQRVELSSPEKVSLALAAKMRLKEKALQRLATLQAGWSTVKTTRAGKKVIAKTTENLFSPTSEVMLMRLVSDLDNDIAQLEGVLEYIKRVGSDDGVLDLDIRIRTNPELEEWERSQDEAYGEGRQKG
jgi:hypothetical protein